MPTFEELKQRYMVTSSGGGSGGSLSGSGFSTAITTFTDSQVLPLINARRSAPNLGYYQVLKAKIDALGTGNTAGQFIYIAGWWLDPNFSLDGSAGTRLVDVLIAKARAGVDVRVLGWVVAPELMNSALLRTSLSAGGGSLGGVRGMLDLNADTMRLINALRGEPTLANKACLNILSHPAGAVHVKMAIVGTNSDASGFTGGLDLHPGRHDPNWHDVEAQVSGTAVQGVFECYRQMWNEIRSRSPVSLTASSVTSNSHTSSMPDLPGRTLASSGGANLHVQSLRTLPRFNFSTLSSMVMPTNRPLSYAPSGLFEIKAAWQKGISGAQKYIYIEDQSFTSYEVFDWINAEIKAKPELRVLLLTGQFDPNDTPNGIWDKLLRIAINDHLLAGLSPAQIDRVALFRHRSKTIHTKTTIVDDLWALVGSANAMRRSLYTDFEHAVAFMDPNSQAVKNYRVDLWGIHSRTTTLGIDPAIAAWLALPWYGSGAASPLGIERLRLPFPRITLTAEEQVLQDEIFDADSRNAWGGGLVSHYIGRFGSRVFTL